MPGEDNYVSNGAKAQVTITGLMPDTTYNVWIRAKQKKGDRYLLGVIQLLKQPYQ